MDGGRKREANGREGGGGGGGDTLTLISLYLAFCIPGCSLSLSLSHCCLLFLFYTPFLPFLASTPLRISCIQCAWMCVCASVCVGWCVVCTVYPNIFCGVFCLLEQVSFSDVERQHARFQLSSLFVCKPFYLSISSHSIYCMRVATLACLLK